MAITNRLRELREGCGESLATVADAVGLERTHLWKIERGDRRCSAEVALKLAVHFAVSVEDLFAAPVVAS